MDEEDTALGATPSDFVPSGDEKWYSQLSVPQPISPPTLFLHSGSPPRTLDILPLACHSHSHREATKEPACPDWQKRGGPEHRRWLAL